MAIKIVQIVLGTIFLLFCAEFIMLPLYAGGLSKEEKAEIKAEVEEAIKDAPLKSFEISKKGKLKIENWLWQIRVLQEQIIAKQVGIREMQAYIDRWYDREKYIRGIKESGMNLYIYDVQTGNFVLKEKNK